MVIYNEPTKIDIVGNVIAAIILVAFGIVVAAFLMNKVLTDPCDTATIVLFAAAAAFCVGVPIFGSILIVKDVL